MLKPIPLPPSFTVEELPVGALRNPAVARCVQAWGRTGKEVFAKRKSEYFARKEACRAYRNAMPPLAGYQDICDFIACVAHGILVEAFTESTASKLLYAAQVALSSVPRPSKTQASAATPATPLPVLVADRTL